MKIKCLINAEEKHNTSSCCFYLVSVISLFLCRFYHVCSREVTQNIHRKPLCAYTCLRWQVLWLLLGQWVNMVFRLRSLILLLLCFPKGFFFLSVNESFPQMPSGSLFESHISPPISKTFIYYNNFNYPSYECDVSVSWSSSLHNTESIRLLGTSTTFIFLDAMPETNSVYPRMALKT